MTKVLLTTKKCSMCCEVLPVSDFHKCSKAVDGLQPRCKNCSTSYTRWKRLPENVNYSGDGIYAFGMCEASYFFRKNELGWDLDKFEWFVTSSNIELKHCNKCGRDLPMEECFSLSNRSADGHQPYCKDCCKEINAEHRARRRIKGSEVSDVDISDTTSESISDLLKFKDKLIGAQLSFSGFLKVLNLVDSDSFKDVLNFYSSLSDESKKLAESLWK